MRNVNEADAAIILAFIMPQCDVVYII